MSLGMKITDNVNKSLTYANNIACSYHSAQVGTEHLLYGLACVTNGVASKILQQYGVTADLIDKVFGKNGEKNLSVSLNPSIELTPRTKEVFTIANQFAMQIGQNYIATEHVLIALLLIPDCYAVKILEKAFHIKIDSLKNTILSLLQKNNPTPKKSNNVSSTTSETYKSYTTNVASGTQQSSSPLPAEILQMGIDLTEKARLGKIDKIIGRKEETDRMIEILCRKTKNNPILIGEAGVGKSAVVEGLALAIVKGNVPDELQGKIIFSLDLASMMSGTQYRGALEEKLKKLIDFIKNYKNVIIFIDEIHTLMQMGGDKGEISPVDILKPYLSRGEFQTIGATTINEYRQYIEKDKALERRFQPIMVNPPSVEDTIAILKGIRSSYENYHHVVIDDSAIQAAAVLSDKYIMDRSLPDKAIDLIDEASARAKVRNRTKSEELGVIEQEITRLEQAKQQFFTIQNFQKASECREQLKKAYFIRDEIKRKEEQDHTITVVDSDIADIISDWTHIPVSKLNESERERLMNLEEILHKRVIGQNEAVSAVCKAIRRNRTGLKDNNRPIGSFAFLGQTGVGKTELCKALAEAMFDNENFVIRLDMSEYMEKHSVSRLIGAPPGYVGFEEGGQLTEAVRRRPYSVVLFDEIEKAHPDVFNLLLQVLDDGRLTDSQGRTVSFKNTIIIFTSNIGVSNLPKQKGTVGQLQEKISYEMIKETLLTAFKSTFKPEFVNRIDMITVFHPLHYEELEQICKIFISNLYQRVSKQGIGLKVTESALRYLIEKGYDSEYGARPLRRLIEQEIEDPIAENIIQNSLKSGDVVYISSDGERLVLKVEDRELLKK